MSARPIIFGADSVRAIFACTKTQTRRIVTDATSQGNWRASDLDLSRAWVDAGPSPAGNPGPYLHAPPTAKALERRGHPADDAVVDRLYPRWFPGDRLWVREAFRQSDGSMSVHYRADLDEVSGGPWRPSIHMPRWASRLTLEITEVRAQRLQEITEEDARAEGARYYADIPAGPYGDSGTRWSMHDDHPPNTDHCFSNARLAFGRAWNGINVKRAPWANNPWVWALTFERMA